MAEFRSNDVEEYFKGKTILVTGATGFLAKIFVEKILRVQPNIKRLYLLVRASNPHAAIQRLHSEVFGKELFKKQRDNWGEKFKSFLSEKVVAVAGDVSLYNFGIKDQTLVEEMLEEIDIMVHTAATTLLDERFDVAMGTNTMGAYNAINFAKLCRKIEVFLYVSTAYVCGEAKGLIPEEPFHMGQTLKSSSKLDINLEKLLMEQKLSELQAQNANEETITSIMKEFGTTRTIDFVIVEYFKGEITSFVGNPKIIVDLIPADMVTNSMMIALLVHSKSNPSNKLICYHIGTSLRNPIELSDIQEIMNLYITSNSWLRNYGKSGTFYKKFTFNPNYTPEDHEFLQNKGSGLKRMTNLYRPYGHFKGIFDDQNTDKLRMAIKGVGNMDKKFNFDPESIDWKHYLMNIHIPGLIKYTMKPRM
ncbi:hypothetical protein PIB30_052855 [Stylosanthes scabra]|uniref:Fatty acyl-CoA reductase n=1 Tax=Stylosanthes scabra TaxID=79078 RepID=A0ABU6UH34_9FABA|nr:hypothetical protein [Stylosanthes scabra]